MTLPTELICDNCGTKEKDQHCVDHDGVKWCLDCMRLAGLCISCDCDIRLKVDDYYNYERDECPDCIKANYKTLQP